VIGGFKAPCLFPPVTPFARSGQFFAHRRQVDVGKILQVVGVEAGVPLTADKRFPLFMPARENQLPGGAIFFQVDLDFLYVGGLCRVVGKTVPAAAMTVEVTRAPSRANLGARERFISGSSSFGVRDPIGVECLPPKTQSTSIPMALISSLSLNTR
jgi:hypothetical protein